MGLFQRRRIWTTAVCLSVFLTLVLYKHNESQSYYKQQFSGQTELLQNEVVILNSRFNVPNQGSPIPTPAANPGVGARSMVVEIGADGAIKRQSPSRSSVEVTNIRSSGETCKLPTFQLDDPDVAKYFVDPPPVICGHNSSVDGRPELPWFRVDNGTFHILPDAVKRHGDIQCDYTYWWRVSEHRIKTETAANFPNGSAIRTDFGQFTCKASKSGLQQMTLVPAVVPNKDVIKRAADKKLKNNGEQKKEGDAGNRDQLNVYILGLDSVSRATFMRKLPKTYAYITRELDGIVLNGYNIVGDGTPQALIPILTGKTETELPLTRKRYKNANYVNVYPWIWDDFSNAGYATLYGEDASHIGTFTYRLKGFNAQPTDHYMRPFFTRAEDLYKKFKKYCIGLEPHIRVHFRYVEYFWAAYGPHIPKFAFQFHSILSHDDINLVGTADDDLLAHLTRFKGQGWLNNTLLMVMSDHGHRFAQFRATQQGQLEERTPFFSLILPKWFSNAHPTATKHLRANSQRLSTPFDIHATLHSVLSGWPNPDPSAKDIASENKVSAIKSSLSKPNEIIPTPIPSLNRSLSLFDAIPASRTCAAASIEPHWCACLSWEKLPITDSLAHRLANLTVAAINRETQSVRTKCAHLSLVSLSSAARYVPDASLLKYKAAKDVDGFVPDLSGHIELARVHFQLRFITQPGGAHYEASLTHDYRSKKSVIDLGAVSHINAFGDLPHCIIDEDYFMAKWCVCYDKIKTKSGTK